MEETKLFFEPIVQTGFLGFSVILLGIVVWLVKKLMSVIDHNSTVISECTQAIREVADQSRDELTLLRSINDKLLSRPCIAKREE